MPDKFADLIEKIEKLTVAELAELVKAMEEKFGVSAASMAASGAGAGAAVAAEVKDTFNVILKTIGEKKIDAIKVVREVTALGLKEAKDLVEAAPKTVKEGVKKEEAEEIKKKFEAVGATVAVE
jgi:large subunit ribosomal protein L7/L12